MAVAFDNATSISAGGISSVTTGNFTVSGANRAGVVCGSFSINSVSSINANIGATAGTAISGADSGTAAASRVVIFGVTAPATGSQAASMGWTTNSIITLGVASATGVDQSTPFNNPSSTTVGASPLLVTVTSAAGDMSISVGAVIVGVLSAANNTERWNETAANYGAGQTAGNGTTSHSWSLSVTETDPIVGVNFKQVASATFVPYRSIYPTLLAQ